MLRQVSKRENDKKIHKKYQNPKTIRKYKRKTTLKRLVKIHGYLYTKITSEKVKLSNQIIRMHKIIGINKINII